MKAIAAMCENRVIGYKGTIPWKNKQDMRFFRGMTINNEVIVGRSTYTRMGPLQDRFHYVLSDSQNGEYTEGGGKPITRFLTLGQLNKVDTSDAWVIGGAKVYQQLLPQCSDLYISFIMEAHEGDSYMPAFEDLFDEQRIVKEFKDMWIVHFWKKGSFFEECYREGFDAGLIGKTADDNPYEESGHPRDTTFDDECNFNWYSGWDAAPRIKGMNCV